jgi:hypothetical protein
MNRRYDPPETQDQRRQIGTDQTAALAPEAAAPRDSAPDRGDDHERPSGLSEGQFHDRSPATVLPPASREFEFVDARPFKGELENALRRLRNAPESADDAMSADTALPRPAPRTPFWEMPNGR